MTNSASSPETPEGTKAWKDANWGIYQKSKDWQDELHKEVAYKSLDIAMPSGIDARRFSGGITWKEILAVGVLVIGGLFAYGYFSSEPDDQEYQVIHRDAQGNIIDVPRWNN